MGSTTNGQAIRNRTFRNADGNDDEILTPAELALRLRQKLSFIYSHRDALGGYRCGKYLLFSWLRVLEALEQGIPPASKKALGK